MKIRSKKHLKFVSEQSCLITGSTGGVQAHHLLRAGGKGMGTKSSDIWAVPLYYTVHDALHRMGDEIAFFENHGLPYEYAKGRALTLASQSPDKKIREAAKLWERENA